MPGFKSSEELSTLTFILYTYFTLSSFVWIYLGVNSVCEDMNEIHHLYFLLG